MVKVIWFKRCCPDSGHTDTRTYRIALRRPLQFPVMKNKINFVGQWLHKLL